MSSTGKSKRQSRQGTARPTTEQPDGHLNRSIQRWLLGTFCILFLAAGILVPWLPYMNDGSSGFAAGTLLKVGVVLFIAWLAAPQLERLGWQRLRGTMLVGLVVVIALFAIRPRIGAIAGALFVGGSMFFGIVSWLRKFTKHPE